MGKVQNLLLFVLPLIFLNCVKIGGELNPFVFIPGDGGSQMDAQLNKPTHVHVLCNKQETYYNIWLNLELLIPIIIDCTIDNIKLIYDNTTRTTRNNDGVEIRIPGFGNTETVEWIDPSHRSSGSYFSTIIEALVKIGYQRNVSLKGAPYDFRKSPQELPEYFVKLKKLIEDTYIQNGNKSVIIVVHSMGALMAQHLLNSQTQEWKDKYISSLVTLAGAWGGSMKALKVYAIGDDLGSFFLSQSTMRQAEITYPSLAWLIPFQDFWPSDEILVHSSTKNYTLSDLRQFFQDLNYMNGWEMRMDTIKFQNFKAPGVDVHCIYGFIPKSTVEGLVYKGVVSNTTVPNLIKGDGDGTVNKRSLEGCKKWKDPNHKLYTKELTGVDHMTILVNDFVTKYILSLVNRV